MNISVGLHGIRKTQVVPTGECHNVTHVFSWYWSVKCPYSLNYNIIVRINNPDEPYRCCDSNDVTPFRKLVSRPPTIS